MPKKGKTIYVIIESSLKTGTIFSLSATDNYGRAVIHVKDRFDEETLTAEIVRNDPMYILREKETQITTPRWVNERRFVYGTPDNLKEVSIQDAEKI